MLILMLSNATATRVCFTSWKRNDKYENSKSFKLFQMQNGDSIVIKLGSLSKL